MYIKLNDAATLEKLIDDYDDREDNE